MLQILANWADYRKLNLQKLGQAAGDFKQLEIIEISQEMLE